MVSCLYSMRLSKYVGHVCHVPGGILILIRFCIISVTAEVEHIYSRNRFDVILFAFYYMFCVCISRVLEVEFFSFLANDLLDYRLVESWCIGISYETVLECLT